MRQRDHPKSTMGVRACCFVDIFVTTHQKWSRKTSFDPSSRPSRWIRMSTPPPRRRRWILRRPRLVRPSSFVPRAPRPVVFVVDADVGNLPPRHRRWILQPPRCVARRHTVFAIAVAVGRESNVGLRESMAHDSYLGRASRSVRPQKAYPTRDVKLFVFDDIYFDRVDGRGPLGHRILASLRAIAVSTPRRQDQCSAMSILAGKLGSLLKKKT